MSDETKRGPVETTGLDAGIAAREAAKAAEVDDAKKTETPQPEAAGEEVEHGDETGEAEAEETQNTEESADSEQGDAKAKPRNRGVGKRIDELTKEKHDERRAREDAQRERDYWRELAMKGGQPQPESEPVQAASVATDEPTLESCDFDQARFQREWYTYQRAQEKKQEAAQQRHQKFADREASFRADHPDYDAVVRNPSLPVTQQMVDVILETDDPPALAYYLGQNPAEAAAIAQMTPHQIGRAIGRIEAKLSAPAASESPRKPEPKTVSRAPAPVTTLSGAPAVKKSYTDMSMKEYDEARRKERAAKGLSNR